MLTGTAVRLFEHNKSSTKYWHLAEAEGYSSPIPKIRNSGIGWFVLFVHALFCFQLLKTLVCASTGFTRRFSTTSRSRLDPTTNKNQENEARNDPAEICIYLCSAFDTRFMGRSPANMDAAGSSTIFYRFNRPSVDRRHCDGASAGKQCVVAS